MLLFLDEENEKERNEMQTHVLIRIFLTVILYSFGTLHSLSLHYYIKRQQWPETSHNIARLFKIKICQLLIIICLERGNIPFFLA